MTPRDLAFDLALKRANLNQTLLAKRVRVTQGAVSRWRSREKVPRTKCLPKIAQALRLSMAETLALLGLQ